MDLLEAARERHSVRDYLAKPLGDEIIAELKSYIAGLNAQSGLNMQLAINEPKAFGSLKARLLPHYGSFRNAVNYVAIIGKKNASTLEKCGYYGEQLVLKAQQLGLNTCWIGGSYKKVPSAFDIAEGESILAAILTGYGENCGKPHRSKSVPDVLKAKDDVPDWVIRGAECALLAPTAINQQKFVIEFDGENVAVRAKRGPFSTVDLGIVKYHFELGSGRKLQIG
ncbi:MAG: nitroreductase family protein [Clostridia bacterium]|nr:nitroreductase family protein [Clostridia bacterium]